VGQLSIKSLSKCTVPETSKKHYLTAITALNIFSEEGTGDWHFVSKFIDKPDFIPRKTVAGIDTCSTNEILGDTGIFDAYSVLIKAGVQPTTNQVYAADHYRATADLLFDSIKKGYDIERSIFLDDWLPEPQEKERLFSLTDQFRDVLTKKEYQRLELWKTINCKG